MNNKTLERVAIIITVLATVVIAANFLKWYLGDLAEDPDVIFWVKVTTCVIVFLTFVIVGWGYYRDRQYAKKCAEYLELLNSFKRDNYQVGKRPPGLEEDGSFLTPFGIRTTMITDDNGDVLIVDKATGLLVRTDPEGE